MPILKSSLTALQFMQLNFPANSILQAVAHLPRRQTTHLPFQYSW